MQGQNLAEMHSSEVLSEQSYSQDLPAETSAAVHNSDKADEYCVKQAGNLDESFEVEKFQISFPNNQNGNGDVHETSPETSYDTSVVESNSSWGDFEAFSEVNISNSPESLGKLSEKQVCMNGVDLNHKCTATSWTQCFSQMARHHRKETSTNIMAASTTEDVIKLSFPDIPVPQFLEKISSLEQILYTETENTEPPECTEQQLCIDSADVWKTLTSCSNLSSLKCRRNESRHQENLLAVLGIDVHQKALPEGEDDILEETCIKENEDSSVDQCNGNMCKSLIQTKLSVSPDARKNHLFTYNLFVKKTPSTGIMQYITVPQKKRIFTTQSLRMKMFSSNIC
ncbi:uncharacterized protein CLBA1 [Anolis carolinensis]|uniref:Aftiphilin clathrin-binding box domain-containing protein n=1 Tax=Anolis carolinensis TaxID=28377 RepID=G1KUU2_ANOCA|nr:PREDICTED: uncharacterized protein C14orf79 homolog [Anolis carolinensis]|eukprot:XP_003214339.1 PREDICTED: uncharacterized protein C14orf79 homolog [Anolis carolinensis]